MSALKASLHSVRSHRAFCLLLAVVALGRIALLLTTQYHANGDDAAIGVMAQKILDGEWPIHPSVADYHLGSALAAYVAAAFFAVLGVSETVLKLPPLLWSLAALWAVYVLVRAVRGPTAALLVSALYAFAVSLLKWSFYSAGGYTICQALFPVVIWLLLSLASVPERARPWHDLLLGFLCGVGTAILVLFAPAAVTVALFLAIGGANRPIWARLARFSLAFAVGCAPMVYYARDVIVNAPHTFVSDPSSFFPNLAEVLTRHLPAMLTYQNIEGSPPIRLVPNGVGSIVLLIGLTLLVLLRASALRSWLRRARSCDTAREIPAEAPLFFYVASYLTLHAVHPFSGDDARHLLPLQPALCILAGLGLSEAVKRKIERPVLAAIAMGTFAVALLNGAAQQARLFRDDNVYGARGATDPRQARAIADMLDADGVSRVVTDDWDLSWRMTFLTRGRIVGCHAVSEQRTWLADEDRHARWRYAVIVREETRRDRALGRRVNQAGIPAVRRAVHGKAVHVLGPAGGNPALPDDWCAPDLLMQPISAARRRVLQ